MEVPNLLPLVEQLDDNIDELEDAIAPLLNQSLAEISKKLPVLDKAKLHIVTTYALESLIFSYLRLHGVDMKEHPVKRELTRVRQYFDKIQALEAEPEQRKTTVDVKAAGRFIKHGLAGNDRFDLEKKELEAKIKAHAQVKAAALTGSTRTSAAVSSQVRSDKSDGADSSDSDGEQIIPEEASVAYEGDSMANGPEKVPTHEVERETSAVKPQDKDEKSSKDSKRARRKRKLERRKARKREERLKEISSKIQSQEELID